MEFSLAVATAVDLFRYPFIFDTWSWVREFIFDQTLNSSKTEVKECIGRNIQINLEDTLQTRCSHKFIFNSWYLSIHFTISSILISENVMSASPSLARKISWIKSNRTITRSFQTFLFRKKSILESFDVFGNVIFTNLTSVTT